MDPGERTAGRPGVYRRKKEWFRSPEPHPERGIMVQPSSAATGYEVVQVRHGLSGTDKWAQLDTLSDKGTAKMVRSPIDP